MQKNIKKGNKYKFINRDTVLHKVECYFSIFWILLYRRKERARW